MNTYFLLTRAAAPFLFVTALLFSLESAAETTIVMSSDYCDVRNPGGAPALKGTRKLEGEIVNILPDFQFTISCPLQTFYPSDVFDVGVQAYNYRVITQRFKCVLQEFTQLDDRVSSYSRSVTLGPGATNSMFFEGIEIANILNRLYMWCALPPEGALGELFVTSY